MATKKGVWNLQQVRDKQLQSLWGYASETNLWIWGRNEHGQLGLNQAVPVSVSSPVQLPGTWGQGSGMLGSDRRLSAKNYVLNIKNDGSLWGWGQNNKGQLGIGIALSNRSSPMQIGGGFDWASIGDLHHYAVSTAIKTDGTLWVWGDGDSKQQYGKMIDRSSPVQVPGTTWASSFTGSNHLGAIKTIGELWLWGDNSDGQLGQNDTTDSYFPLQVPGTDWVSVTGSVKCTIATKNDGTLWSWGHNDYGQLGQSTGEPAKVSSPVQVPGTTWTPNISTTNSNILAVKSDGTLWGSGINWAGNIGDNTIINRSSPTQVPGSTWKYAAVGNYMQSFGIKQDGTLWSWGNNRYGGLAQNSVSPGPGNSGISSPTQIPGTWVGVAGAGTDNGGVALRY